MKRLLVTGADGFVGRWLVRAARADGYQVIPAILPSAAPLAEWTDAGGPALEVVHADLAQMPDVERLGQVRADAVVHLAAIASGAAARANPEAAFRINSVMTAAFADIFAEANPSATFLFVSTGEVYGADHPGPIPETAPRDPRSPYAESKVGAEAALEALRADGGLPVVTIARAFPHTGPGQSTAYVLPALAARLNEAKRTGSRMIATGNLATIRDFLDVRDVVQAYLALLEKGAPGSVYNVASGVGRRLSDCFAELARLVGIEARAVEDAALLRPGDIPVLIGDATHLRQTTGWTPQIPFERTLQDLVNAQAD